MQMIKLSGLFARLVILLMLPVTLQAGSGWSDYTTVVELMPSSQHRYTLQLQLTDNPSGCRSKDTFYQDYAASGAEQMFHTLLEALIAGKRVRVFVTGRCELNGFAEISSVGILP
jgi:hypothetical protein